jgi:hypothetical protein
MAELLILNNAQHLEARVGSVSGGGLGVIFTGFGGNLPKFGDYYISQGM